MPILAPASFDLAADVAATGAADTRGATDRGQPVLDTQGGGKPTTLVLTEDEMFAANIILVDSRPDATSYSYKYRATGTIGRHEVVTIYTDRGTMRCRGGGNTAYVGDGYMPNDGAGRRFYRTQDRDNAPSGGNRQCNWLGGERREDHDVREPRVERRVIIIKRRPETVRQPAPAGRDCGCNPGGGGGD